MKDWLRRQADNAGAFIHAIHGSRGLFLGALGLLILTVADPALPRDLNQLFLTTPVFVVLAIGLATLPREGVAAQRRALAVLDEPDAPTRMGMRLWWPAGLLILLSPNVFLAMYGVPHLNPFTGLLRPDAQVQVTSGFLFVVLLFPALYLRSSRRYAPAIVSSRPKDMPRHDHQHRERDALLWMGTVLLIAWAWLLSPFWTPFSLFDWPPSLQSFAAGPRGVGSIAFALTVPLALWLSLVAHIAMVREVARRKAWKAYRKVVVLAALHVLIIMACIVLHAYDLLWVAQYRSAAGF